MNYPAYLLKFIIPLFIFAIILMGCDSSESPAGERNRPAVSVGAEVLIDEHLEELEGLRIGLVMNPTARVDGTHMLDTLLSRNIRVTALFAPEHGFRGEAGAGEVIEDGIDRETGLPVYSLYGDTKKPTPAMLDSVDILLFDMQDVGARFYTYNVTMGLLLEAAAENEIPVWVLDRPNPAGGDYMAGWMLDKAYKSFVGAYPIPMAHGMTLGELAQMMVGEGWLETDQQPELKVIQMKGWQRSMKWPDTGLEWYPPSPNLPTFEHSYTYLGTVLFEGTNISEGRGTDDPFLTIGAPFIKLGEESINRLHDDFPSVSLEAVIFTPKSMPGKALNPKHKDAESFGVKIGIENYESLNPVQLGVRLLQLMMQNSDEAQINDFIYKLAGSEEVTTYDPGTWEEGIKAFKEKRAPYLLYN